MGMCELLLLSLLLILYFFRVSLNSSKIFSRFFWWVFEYWLTLNGQCYASKSFSFHLSFYKYEISQILEINLENAEWRNFQRNLFGRKKKFRGFYWPTKRHFVPMAFPRGETVSALVTRHVIYECCYPIGWQFSLLFQIRFIVVVLQLATRWRIP